MSQLAHEGIFLGQGAHHRTVSVLCWWSPARKCLLLVQRSGGTLMAGSSMEPVEPDKTAAEMEPIVSCSDREVCFGLHAQC